MTTLECRREEALIAGHRALQGRIDLAYEDFRNALHSWDVKAFVKGHEVIGMLMTKGDELHVAIVPEARGRWLSRRLIREVLGPILDKYGRVRSSLAPGNEQAADFDRRLGFTVENNRVELLREGFASKRFDPVTLLAGASVVGSLIGAGSSSNAASQASSAANNATAAQMQMFNTINQQQAPYRQAGYTALKDIAKLQPQFTHQFNAADLKTNLAPNYQFQLDQGLGAVRNAANTQEGLLSGNTLKGINDYAQNYAGNAYQQAFNNYSANQTNIFNRLSSIAGLGQTANANVGNAGATISGNAAQSQIAGGAAQAAGTVGVGNALAGGLQNAASWYALPQLLNLGGGSSGSSLGGGSGFDPSLAAVGFG